ncbi:MAG TPA: tyrosine-type recombinase/integrase [Acidimicrobiales bacterium]|jgi:site-specific recombinase XerD|nr:tyrosine-type recombinase/integrase [Acidimicrobiales bacterium]
MSALAPVMEGFFTERLIGQLHASPHTVASYRDAFRLLLGFAQRHIAKAPSKLALEDLDAVVIGAFLDHLEVERHNSVATRNNRRAAIHSLFAYAALRHPEHAALIQRVLAIPAKRTHRQLVSFLTDDEIDAVLAAPDRETWIGRRDHALLLVTIHTGLRVSELTALTCADVELTGGAHLRCHGKGRKERITPLTTEVAAVLRVWLAERRGAPHEPVFPSRRRGALSRDAVAVLVAHHVRTAASRSPSLATKTVTPHVLRHTCAMRLLAVGVDTSVIALWLGHEGIETTQIYLHADLAIKEQALARTAPTGAVAGRYRPSDSLLAFLENL